MKTSLYLNVSRILAVINAFYKPVNLHLCENFAISFAKMGQTQANQRLETIKDNVDQITEKLKSDELSGVDRSRSHHILLDYMKELNLILSKSLKASKIRKVEKLVIAALEELATLEGNFKSIEPRLRSKSLYALHEIEENTKNISANLKNQNLDNEKETINNYKKRLSLIGDVDHEVEAAKSKVLDVVNDVENALKEMEIVEKLKEIEEKHNQGKLDLSRFVGVTESNCYKKHKKYLQTLKEELNLIPDVSENISERKKYLSFNIDNNITALDKKAVENENNIKEKMVETGVVKSTTPVVAYTNQSLGNFIKSYQEFEQLFTANCSVNELEDIVAKLKEVKSKIEQKLQVLENQIETQEVNPFVKLVQDEASGDHNPNEIPVAPPRIVNRIQQIEAEVENIQQHIETSKKDSHVYATFKKKLQDYKIELNDLSPINEENYQRFDNILKVIDNILRNLNDSFIDRRSSSGDNLIDVMSINSNVIDLGKSIQMINTLEDCDVIERELIENLYFLKKMDIPFARSSVCQLRDYLVIQIDSHLSNLGKIKARLCRPDVAQARNEQMISF